MTKVKSLVFSALLMLSATFGAAQTALLTPEPKIQFLSATGVPLSGGCVQTYAAGTTTPQASFTDSTGGVSNTNPVILDSAGRASIFLSQGIQYKFVVTSFGGSNCATGTLQYTQDNIALGSTLTVGGSNTQVQYNSAGALAGSANFTWNNATQTLTIGALVTTSGGTLAGTFAGSPTLSGNWGFQGTNTHTGAETFKTLNLRQMCDQYAGATFDAKVNACIAAVIAQGGGIADATGLTGAQSQTAEIDVGTNTVSGVTNNTISVTLLLSPYLVDTFTLNSAGACAFKIFNESRLIGTVQGSTHSAIITTGAGTNTGAMVCSNAGPAAGQYVTVQGLQLYNPNNTGTYTNGALYAINTFDTSSFGDLVISNQGGIGLHVRATCCATVFRNIISDGNHVANSIPVQIDSFTGDLQPVLSTMFYGLSADHPGVGKNAILIRHTYASTNNPCTISFNGVYLEGNSTDTTTPLILIDSCASTLWNHVTAQFRAVGSTAVAFNVVNTSVGGINPIVNLQSFQYQNSGIVFPYTALTDNYRTASAVTDSQGTLATYSGGDAEVLVQQSHVFGYTGWQETAAPAAAASKERCYADSAVHALKCSYNNGSFFAVPQVIGAGTAVMTTAGILTGACGTTVTVAATGVATTDTINFAHNAAATIGNGGGLTLNAWPTANNVNFNYCNSAAGTITPTAMTLNWNVTR